jgi:hypothetical protein
MPAGLATDEQPENGISERAGEIGLRKRCYEPRRLERVTA